MTVGATFEKKHATTCGNFPKFCGQVCPARHDDTADSSSRNPLELSTEWVAIYLNYIMQNFIVESSMKLLKKLQDQ